jgi:hypothetical protein
MKLTEITSCKHCGSKHLLWHTWLTARNDVQQGRLRTNDVECVFVLGCEDCFETLYSVGADRLARMMNSA